MSPREREKVRATWRKSWIAESLELTILTTCWKRPGKKAEERGLAIEFKRGDAHDLPVEAGTFDLVISECTTCALNKPRAIWEMVRVAKPGDYVGISDLYWKEGTPEEMRAKLVELENERPESLAGWAQLFEQAGLEEVHTKICPARSPP